MATFYSRNTGNWEDGANWSTVNHAGTAGASPGVKGIDWPGSGDTAIISAGHTITVTTDLSGEATAITLQCDNPGTNNGTLTFSPTATTGLKFTLNGAAINSASTFNMRAGTRTAPIRRGNTCTLIAGSAANMAPSSGTFTFEMWGQHREMSATDVYCDVLTAAASERDTTITVNGDVSPAWDADEWIWIVQTDTSSSTTNRQRAELVQIDSYNAGTKVITLKNPLKNDYATTGTLVFRANQHFVNTVLDADNSSGSPDFVLQDNIWPSGTGGGTILIGCAANSARTNNENLTYLSYNAGTKTITTTANSSNAHHIKGSCVAIRDTNVVLQGASGSAREYRLGTRARMCYAEFIDWSVNGSGLGSLHGFVAFNTNWINIVEPWDNPNWTGNFYGLGNFYLPTGQSANQNWFSPSSTIGGSTFTRCRLTYTNDGSINTGTLINAPIFCRFEDCYMHSTTRSVVHNPVGCTFKDCSIGQVDSNTNACLFNPVNCSFDNVAVYGSNSILQEELRLQQGSSGNVFNRMKFGYTLNDKEVTIANETGIKLNQGSGLIVMNGVTHRAFGGTGGLFTSVSSKALHNGWAVRMSNINGVENTFHNFMFGGDSISDFSEFRSNAPSIKFTHNANNGPVFHDIPMFLEDISYDFSIYTKTSTGTWIEPPQVIVIPENMADLIPQYYWEMNYLDRQVQGTLTPGSYQLMTWSWTPPAPGMYILRLWSVNGSGTVNWDDLTVVPT